MSEINVQRERLNVDQISQAARVFVKNFPGKTFGKVVSGTPQSFLSSLWEQGITHYEVNSFSALRLVHVALPEATICFTGRPVMNKDDIAQAYYNYGVRIFSLNSLNDLTKIRMATNDALDLTLCLQIDELVKAASPFQNSIDGVKLVNLAELLSEMRRTADILGIGLHIDVPAIYPKVYETALNTVRSLIVAAAVTVDFINVGGWFPLLEKEHGQPKLSEYFDTIHRSFENLPISYSAELWCEPGLAFHRANKPTSFLLEQNTGAPVFEENEDGRIGIDKKASPGKLHDDEEACRRHSLVRLTLAKALDVSHIDRTQCYKIGDSIDKALASLGEHPTLTDATAYLVYSKAIRRQMKDLLSGQSIKPPLSEDQVDRLQEWMDADAAFISFDEWLAKIENAIYERRFGPVAAERETLAEMIEAVRDSGTASQDAQDILDASIDSLPDKLDPHDSDAKLATETNSNFWRQFGRTLSSGWTRGKEIAPKLWNLAQWAAERSTVLKEKMPGLSWLWDFIKDFAGK